jgi:very-short-patch-repair endonuclease
VVNLLARKLRNNATDAERKLWQELRLLKTEGVRFRRQVPIGKHIADFACHRFKLVVELDGGQHGSESGIAADALRTSDLAEYGFHVLRFWNSDVFEGLEGVVDRIRHEVHLPTINSYEMSPAGATPTPDPSPQGGGEMLSGSSHG